jgi:hypothetical protein
MRGGAAAHAPMLVLYCTQQLLARLGRPFPREGEVRSTTRLGDWYRTPTQLWSRRFVLLTSQRSRLSLVLLVRAADRLASEVPAALGRILGRLDVGPTEIDRELKAMTPMRLALTNHRSHLGALRDLSFLAQGHMTFGPWPASLDDLSLTLAESPCSALKDQRPRDVVRRLLGRDEST